MQAFKVLNGKTALLNRVNVDTDQIIPKQFLRKIGRTGFGGDLFFDWRYLEDGSDNPDFELNRPEFKGASILLAGDNFGCGSSREHAPWALSEYGFRSIISTSFADIFFNNCYKNGMLPIVVSPENHQMMVKEVETNPGCSFLIDLPSQTVRTHSGKNISFDIDPFRKEFMLKGMDDIGWTLQFESMIGAFEEKQRQQMPWLWLRKDYTQSELTEDSVRSDAMVQFNLWLEDACRRMPDDYNAMTLATADNTGHVSARIVLLRVADDAGFSFFTNYDSHKGQELAKNASAALCFFWGPLERQVNICGTVQKMTTEESYEYFKTRPRESCIGAWASLQSQVMKGGRAELEQAYQKLNLQFSGQDIPLPPNWGGYRLFPSEISFWQGRASRLHDRIRYTREKTGWRIERLYP
ncbi:hypothetical protein CHS0354_002077 [Potamilus streckersoni]|uniref:3-isopropylmalate dehydratase n=1 Tax=Potamilus streckersoni TaxID=2493646 RepID=A0AAE0T5R3_9BIVA|nr:hypothetical protein CHS0354_002077 [Potamilus streckersoni]